MQYVLPLAVLCGLVSIASAQRVTVDKPTGIEEQVVIIESNFLDGRTNNGSGVLIDSRTVLTAMHNIRSETIKVYYGGEEIEAVFQKLHFEFDWALFQCVRDTRAKPIPIRKEPIRDGERLTAMGYGVSLANDSIFPERKDRKLFRWFAIAKGIGAEGAQPVSCDSGGPVFDGDGALVSLISDRVSGRQQWGGYGAGELHSFCFKDGGMR